MTSTGRVLPFTIAVLASLLVLKTISLAGVAFARSDDSPARGVLNAAEAPKPRPVLKPPAVMPAVSDDRRTASRQSTSPTRPPSRRDPLGWDLLNAVQAEKHALDERAQTLAARESALDASQATLDARFAKLSAMQRAIDQHDAVQQRSDEKSWASLVKLYETMRAEDAATIFDTLELRTTVEIIGRMKERKSASILGAMLPERARLVTQLLAVRSNGQDRSHDDFGPPGR